MINNFNQGLYPYYSPINVPSRRSYVNPLNGRKSRPLKDLINKAERSVDTINSIIPLYKKVQPVIEQGKTIFSSIGTFFKKNDNKKQEKNIEKVEAEIVEEPHKEVKEEKVFDYRVNESNSKPFFL